MIGANIAFVFKMVRCLLCNKEFKTKRGLSVHLSRTHNIQGCRGRLSLKTVKEFFPLLENNRWKKAKKFLKTTLEKMEDDEWTKGYTHALDGMISALKGSYSPPQPYIVRLKEFNNKKLQQVQAKFDDLSDSLSSKNAFDAAYFQAWEDFTQYVLQMHD
jgi:hypothetical protein